MVDKQWAWLGGSGRPTHLDWYTAGRWRVAFADGALRYVAADGVELLRGVDFVIRDANWGTIAPTLTRPVIEADGSRLRIAYEATAGEGPALAYAAEIGVEGDCVTFAVDGQAQRAFETNRTGFSVLHPLDGFVGAEVTPETPDARATPVRIPELVSPAQPLRDIEALAFTVNGLAVRIAFEAAEPFEMEDQRNWTDASFKTYYRPLSRPFPYRLAAGETFTQHIRVGIEGRSAGRMAGTPRSARGSLPARALVWLPDDPLPDAAMLDRLGLLKPDRFEGMIDLRNADAPERAECAQRMAETLGGALHLRLILDDNAEPAPALAAVAARSRPVSVLALPAAYLKSHQPDGTWPQGLSCAAALDAVRVAFPQAEAVEGMLTFFTEFNRHPPRAGGAAVAFSTAGIVHAADDISVMETLEALQSVLSTARAYAGDRPIDIGLAAIGLWTNPYGATLAENPNWSRMAMTARDPRWRGLFGAAWLTGYLAHSAAAGVRSVGVGAVSGPLGLLPMEDDGEWRARFPDAVVRPAYHAVAALSHLGDRISVQAPRRPGELAALRGNGRALVANTGPNPLPTSLNASAARILSAETIAGALADPGWMLAAPDPFPTPLTLPPYGLALLGGVETP